MARGTRGTLLYLLVATAALLLLEGAEGTPFPNSKGRSSTVPRPYKRFHANDSFIGKPIPCSSDEKICFRYNLVFHKKGNVCGAMGGGYVGGCDLRAIRSRSGRLYGACRQFDDPCPGYRMAYDGLCYTKDLVRNTICGCSDAPTRHFLGGVECRCSPLSAPVRVEQPKEDGRCRIPDLRHPDITRSSFLKSPLRSVQFSNLTCSAEQKKCFAQGKVWVAEKKACLALLERGSCAEDQVVVLTKQKWVGGPAVCINKRGGCPVGRVRMAFDGKCHSEREMKIAAPGRIDLNIMGEYEVLGYSERRMYKPSLHNNDCSFGMSGSSSAPPGAIYPKPPCSKKDKSQCPIYQVHSIAPMPQ